MYGLMYDDLWCSTKSKCSNTNKSEIDTYYRWISERTVRVSYRILREKLTVIRQYHLAEGWLKATKYFM
jgi:hypothetical protein